MSAPPPHVLAAFGVSAEPLLLAGGRGTAWRCGELVLKPLDASVEELEWQGMLFDTLPADGFRVSRSRGIRGGWCAWEYVVGEHRERAWPEIIAVGERFHAAISDVRRPPFLDRRTDHWAMGDRVAWGELPAADLLHVKHLPRLLTALRPVDAGASQLVKAT